MVMGAVQEEGGKKEAECAAKTPAGTHRTRHLLKDTWIAQPVANLHEKNILGKFHKGSRKGCQEMLST